MASSGYHTSDTTAILAQELEHRGDRADLRRRGGDDRRGIQVLSSHELYAHAPTVERATIVTERHLEDLRALVSGAMQLGIDDEIQADVSGLLNELCRKLVE